MDPSVFTGSFALVFLAELGDKTQLTAMALAAKYPWRKVFVGIAAAFVVLNLAAVSAGKVLFLLVPLRWVYGTSGLLFLFFGVTTLCAQADEGEAQRRVKVGGPILAPFVLILLAELGDKTQLATAGLAAQSPHTPSVFAGSTLALWTVSLLGILLGRQITRLVPLAYVRKGAGAVFLLFGALALRRALLGG